MVSVLRALIVMLVPFSATLTACASNPDSYAVDESAGAPGYARIVVENAGIVPVGVFVLSEEWPVYLGRVLPGETARLRILERSLDGRGSLRLAAVPLAAGEASPSQSAVEEAALHSPTIDAHDLIAQRWRVTMGGIETFPSLPRTRVAALQH